MIDSRFLPHNSHHEEPERFQELDPQLRRLRHQALIWHSPLIEQLPEALPGIYTLGGGRQVGKTTLLKQWMHALLQRGVAPSRIGFVTGELIDDHHALVRILEDLLAEMPPSQLCFLIVDEVSYIKGWGKGVKYLADLGALERVALIVTGSDLTVIQDARLRLPGRRGRAERADFHLHPLSFGAFVQLAGGLEDPESLLEPSQDPPPETMATLQGLLERYLMHGGYLTAMNDMAMDGVIAPSTFRIYAEWLRGDMLKRGRQEHYLREVLASIIQRLGSQITWNALSRELSIDHPKTVQDYVELLVSMDAVFVQPALLEQKLVAAPKKARKLMFTDPFIHHAAVSWLRPTAAPFDDQVRPAVLDPIMSSRLVESVVATHHRRFAPTFYIKARGEVDVAVVRGRGFTPIEVKWRARLRAGDLKQVAKYDNGVVWAPVASARRLQGVPVRPLALELLRLDGAGAM